MNRACVLKSEAVGEGANGIQQGGVLVPLSDETDHSGEVYGGGHARKCPAHQTKQVTMIDCIACV